MKEKNKNRSKETIDELKQLSPFLSKIPEHKQPFNVPDNYFEQLQKDVFAQIRHEESLKQPDRSNSIFDSIIAQLQQLFQPKIAIALATLLLVITAGWLVLQNNTTSDTLAQVNLYELSTTEISNYIEDNLDDFAEEEILQTVADHESITIFPKGELSTGELDEYLDEVMDEIDEQDLEELF